MSTKTGIPALPALAAHKNPPATLFWSKPALPDGEFSPEDPLAFDYLAQQVGLWLFPSFTTRTSRAQYYPVVLYGLYLAGRAVSRWGLGGSDLIRTRLFERWERFWALACIQSHDGKLNRGEPDAMRGIQGAIRAWRPGDAPLPLDFDLISRQNELGGLGAYLSSLREYGLVGKGNLQPTPLAHPIIDSFWAEPGLREMRNLYEAYALQALDPGRTYIPRVGPAGRLRLGSLGQRARLTALFSRSQQQERLWHVLFDQAKDLATQQLAAVMMRAEGRIDLERPYASEILDGVVRGTWGSRVDETVIEKARLGLAFGRASCVLLDTFDLLYAQADQNWSGVALPTVASATLDSRRMQVIQLCCRQLLACRNCTQFSRLEFHGKPFIILLERLPQASPLAAIRQLLAYHAEVQRTRRGAAGWLVEDAGKLLMKRPGYTGYTTTTPFPDLKFSAVRQLLADLGKIHAG